MFPLYDTRPGTLNFVTVTNIDESPASPLLWTEWVYMDGEDCFEFNREESFTGADTLTVVAGFHNPDPGQGYLTVFAKESNGQEAPATVHNYLVGTSTVMDAFTYAQFTVEPTTFAGIGDGTYTDIDEDGIRDLDGVEYSEVADEYDIPRFYGQNASFDSELVLVDLTAGRGFETAAEFLIYNDNEQLFSQEFFFHCWTRTRLSDISGFFGQDWLENFTDHDRDEILGAPTQEAGWYRVDGGVATMDQIVIDDPALLCIQIDKSGNNVSSVHPFAMGFQANGGSPPPGGFLDCNENGIPDDEDIANGTSSDCNGNGIPDECELDCDGDGVPDDCEEDCNVNGVPDHCEPFDDCNSNGIPDECDPDCDADGIPDDCEVDCNSNGIPDECESFEDCNQNGVPDDCDFDGNDNGIPDECEPVCPTGLFVELWPPNHRYHDVDLDALAGVTNPLGGPISISIDAITQDEPVNGNGDGNTVCDGYGIGSSIAHLRSERAGGGDGRVYVVHYTATNSLGNSCGGTFTVTVPHSQNGDLAVDSGQVHDSTEGCQ